ncbi:MAG: hypothetical protein ABR555_07545 [Pyrinomonadaceae bacterium]
MKEKHITALLDNGSWTALTEAELTAIREHAKECVTCDDALIAARVCGLLLKERAIEVIEPSPFFQTRVMAAWREQQLAESFPVLRRLWQSAGALVSSMAVTTAALAVFAFWSPGAAVVASDTVVASNPYSAEAVLLDQNSNENPITYEQVLNAIYAEEDEAK